MEKTLRIARNARIYDQNAAGGMGDWSAVHEIEGRVRGTFICFGNGQDMEACEGTHDIFISSLYKSGCENEVTIISCLSWLLLDGM